MKRVVLVFDVNDDKRTTDPHFVDQMIDKWMSGDKRQGYRGTQDLTALMSLGAARFVSAEVADKKPDVLCPVHKTAMYYSQHYDLHACQNRDCRYSRGVKHDVLEADRVQMTEEQWPHTH